MCRVFNELQCPLDYLFSSRLRCDSTHEVQTLSNWKRINFGFLAYLMCWLSHVYTDLIAICYVPTTNKSSSYVKFFHFPPLPALYHFWQTWVRVCVCLLRVGCRGYLFFFFVHALSFNQWILDTQKHCGLTKVKVVPLNLFGLQLIESLYTILN